MAIRDKRSVSLPPELAHAIDEAAAQHGTTFSGWLAEMAAERLRIEAGHAGLAEWEAENGPLTEEELAEGAARGRRLLGYPEDPSEGFTDAPPSAPSTQHKTRRNS